MLADRVVLSIDDHPIACYVFHDDKILRPYFAHVRAPFDRQITRNHPPGEGDRDDHATMHPGIWIAFGDINGHDFWRNQGRVEHVSFLQSPVGDKQTGSFIQLKRYVAPDGSVVCDEEFHFTLRAQTNSYLMIMDSLFSSSSPFYFGDQEEMGIGVRVATQLSEITGGKLRDSHGRTDASDIWGQAATWCDYSGTIGDQPVGVAIFCSPSNFRESWFHARDYGLLVANAFGRKAMHQGSLSKITVSPNETLRLRYAIWVHNGGDQHAIDSAFRNYAEQFGR